MVWMLLGLWAVLLAYLGVSGLMLACGVVHRLWFWLQP